MHKKIMAIVLTLAMLLTLAACGTSNQSSTQTTAAAAGSTEAAAPAEEEPITCTLTIWSPSEDQDPEYGAWIVTMCEQFAELHPNWDITFNYGVCTESDAKSLIPQDLDAAADVFVYSSTGLEKLCQSNSLAQFGGTYLDQINENYSSVLVDCLTYEDGGVYGVPMTTNTYFMYYDSSVFTEEDITSLEAMLEKGKVAISLTDGFYLSCFYLANGCTFFGESGTDRAAGVDLSGDKAVAVTDYLVDLAKNENLVVASPADAISMMREGQVDAYFCGTWQAAQTEEVLGENYGVAPLPTIQINGEAKQLRPFSSAKAIGVKSTTAYPEVAIPLAMYLAGYESQVYHYENRGYVPCHLSLVEDPEIQSDVVVKVDSYSIDNIAVPRASFTEMSYFWSAAESFGTAIRDGVITHDNAAEQTQLFHDSSNSSGVD